MPATGRSRQRPVQGPAGSAGVGRVFWPSHGAADGCSAQAAARDRAVIRSTPAPHGRLHLEEGQSSPAPFHQVKGQTWTCGDGATSMFGKSCWYLFLVNDRIAPVIHDNPLREQLCADSAPVTQDGIDHEVDPPPCHRCFDDMGILPTDASGLHHRSRPSWVGQGKSADVLIAAQGP